MIKNFKADMARYYGGRPATLRRRLYALCEMPLWAIAVFRFGKWVQRLRFTPVRVALLAIYFVMYKVVEALAGIRISSESEIGPGLVIHNFNGVLIKGTIGKNCTIVQGAQLISRADGKARGWPTLGDNVTVGAGAKVLGPVKIGDNVRIGANAVVLTDVPAGSVVMPPESRVIRNFFRPRRPTAEFKKGPSQDASDPAPVQVRTEEETLS